MIHPQGDAVHDDGHHGDALEPRVGFCKRGEIFVIRFDCRRQSSSGRRERGNEISLRHDRHTGYIRDAAADDDPESAAEATAAEDSASRSAAVTDNERGPSKTLSVSIRLSGSSLVSQNEHSFPFNLERERERERSCFDLSVLSPFGNKLLSQLKHSTIDDCENR